MTIKGKLEKRNEERGTERKLVPLISGTCSVPRSFFEKKEPVPVPFLKKVERVPKALRNTVRTLWKSWIFGIFCQFFQSQRQNCRSVLTI